MPDATVEVLTAEVRTLMVGNRQVTLSVFGQLDWILPTAIEPFGRVNTKEKWIQEEWPGSPYEAEVQYVAVVGRIRTGFTGAGSLARSRVAVKMKNVSQIVAKDVGLQEVARDWSTLPLIVLAGLR